MKRGMRGTASCSIGRCSVRCPQRIDLREDSRAGKSAETADATTLCAINADDLAGVCPILGTRDEAGPDRILADVIPFSRVGLIAAQQMIEKPRLPERSQGLDRQCHRLAACSQKNVVKAALQPFHPLTDRDFAAHGQSHKHMHMIRHEHVSPDAEAMIGGPMAIVGKWGFDVSGREEMPAAMRVEGKEEKRRVVFLKHTLEPRRFALTLLFHKKRCSVRCPQRTSLSECDIARSAGDSGRYKAGNAGLTAAAASS